MDNNAKSQAIDQIKKAQNVLVTVSDNPSVDQLSACIGFTLLLNKLNKHATAVFSGKIPSTIEFLKPEDTLETNTDSLRDFIISLDKNKADKLRYKVEDDVVKIYITPYRTSISDKDLVFDQGDFNVDVIVALGVHSQDQLDNAIQNHGRILHDATIVSVVTGDTDSDIGGINWKDKNASSLCEMLMSISDSLKPGLVDDQIATALLTGIVSETDRFSNQKTTPKAMTMSAQLMSAGANQLLIAESLQKEQPSDTLDTDDFNEIIGTSLTDIQTDESDQAEEEAGVLNLHHERDVTVASKENSEKVANDDLGILSPTKSNQQDNINNPDVLREVVNKVQQNRHNFIDDTKTSGVDYSTDLIADYPLPEPDNGNNSKGSFKGKTIAPPQEYQVDNSILNQMPSLPSLDSVPSYNPGGSFKPAPALPDSIINGNLGPNSTDNNYSNNGINFNERPVNSNSDENNKSASMSYRQGPDYIDSNYLPKQHNEDMLTEEEAQSAIAKNRVSYDIPPEIKLDKSKQGYLDHAPSTGPNDSEELSGDDQELPSIEQGKPKYSRYLGDPPKDNPKLNALEGVVPEQTINPFAESNTEGQIPRPQDIKSTQDPLLATQHDAESALATDVPETKSPRLYDDGVGVGQKPLGAPVDDKDTLDKIEQSVEHTTGAVHGHKVNDARRAVNDAFEELDLNSLQYLDLDSDPASKQAKQPDSDTQYEDAPPLPPPLMPPGMPS